jgi:hypothetical protein
MGYGDIACINGLIKFVEVERRVTVTEIVALIRSWEIDII